MANHTPLDIEETTSTFPLFPFLSPELRLKILHFALEKPGIITLAARDHRLSILGTPHPLLCTSFESRTEAMRLKRVYSTPTPDVSSLMLNSEMDYLFLADEKTVSRVLESNMTLQSPDNGTLGSKLRRLAVPLTTFESLLRAQPSLWLRDLFRTFPNLEEIVLVAGEASVEVLTRDVEFVMPRERNIPRKGPLVTLCEERFHPWRAFAHLMGAEMMEDAVGNWVVEKHAANGEWKVPKFRIRELRLSGSKK